MEYRTLITLLSLIESNKAYINLNKRYVEYYTQSQISELNEMVNLIQQKKEITNETSELLEKTDMFPNVVDSELFERVKAELNTLNELTVDYFMHHHATLSAISNDTANLSNIDQQTATSTEEAGTEAEADYEFDLQSKLNDQIRTTESRIHYLKSLVDTFDEM